MSSTLDSINFNRISGLASGIDYETIIKNLMKAQSAPLDRLNQNKTLLQWKQQDYTDLAKKIYAFKQKVFNMELSSSYKAKTVSVSNNTVAGVTAGSSAVNGTYAINVSQLASAAYMTGTDDLPSAYKSDGTVMTLAEQFGITDETGEFAISNGTSSKDISVNFSTDTVFTLASKINKAGIGVTASYDENIHRFSIMSNTTGSSNVLSYTDASVDTSDGAKDFLSQIMNLPESSTGKDAVFEFNGATLTQSNNSFQINGLSISLSSTGSTTLTVNDDNGHIYDQIKSILNDYNDLIAEINSKISEKKDNDCMPLTDDQREQLSDKQQEEWEEKAKAGLLNNDSILSNLLTSMRKSIYSKVDGADPAYDRLTDLGVTTGQWYENGKLYIDDDKLKNAVESDPDAAISLMKNIMSGLNTQIDDGLSKIKKNSGDYLGTDLYDQSYMANQIRDLNDRILDTQDRLKDIEDRYYSQFTQMEQMISQMNAQSAWLSQQFQ